MIIRKIRRNGIVSGKKIITYTVVIVLAMLCLKGISYFRWQRNQVNSGSITLQQIWQSVTVKWYLGVDNNFPNYTHHIIDSNKNNVGLKSATINLNAYSWQVEIMGTVEKFVKFTPVVEVTSLKLPKQKLVLKNSSYYFSDNFILLDFSTQPQLSAVKSGAEIIVWFGDKEVVKIERFSCSKILKWASCDTLRADYIKKQKDNFWSIWGYEFYKHGTWTRITFEGTSFGYIFKDIDDETIVNLSSTVKLANTPFVFANKAKEIQSICPDITDATSEKIANSKIRYSTDGIITLTIKGQNNQDAPATCILTFDTWNSRAVKRVLPNGA